MVRRGGWCAAVHLREENARFLLLAVVMVLYMLAGATVFHLLEREEEHRARSHFWTHYRAFLDKYNGTVDPKDVNLLLYEYGNASAAGVVHKRPRWDFPGAFYFVGTVVSTIGFGMTTPKTIPGRIIVIFYGLLGCSGAILFFNLFLERIITLLACILRAIHERELRRKGGVPERRDSQASLDDRLDEWKPSVYWVMLCLLLATVLLAALASLLYSPMEEWTYLESLYFCFIAFATIGFGDLVSSQQPDYKNAEWYRLANFFVIVCGCCCIYSLFNVLSIVIKQFLNWLIRKLDCTCRCRKSGQRKEPVGPRTRRNAITPDHIRTLASKRGTSATVSDSDSSDEYERRNSGEFVAMRTNKVSLALLQKELYESAQRGRATLLPPGFLERNNETFKPGSVGPLAIVAQKLGEERL